MERNGGNYKHSKSCFFFGHKFSFNLIPSASKKNTLFLGLEAVGG
jgi:hypothetical protein